MKQIHLLLILLAIACRPDAPEPCEIEQLGKVRIQNFSADQYEVALGQLVTATVDAGGSTDLLQVPAGIYLVRMENLRTGGRSQINDFEVRSCEYGLIPIIF